MDAAQESVDAEIADDVIRIRYRRLVRGLELGGEMVIDRSNAPWLAAQLDAFIQDEQRPRARRTAGCDDIEVYGSGEPYRGIWVNVLNNREAAPVWARDWAFVMTARYAAQLATLLRELDPPPLA